MVFEPRDYPILAFDASQEAILEPSRLIPRKDIPRRCVITFFREVIEKKLAAGQLKQVETFATETVNLPIYETIHKGVSICLIQGFLGSAGAAGELEELIAHGCEKFLVCGSAGVLQKDIAVGHLVVPCSAVRDEGASYHYLPPAREVECNPHALQVIKDHLDQVGLPYIQAKTWTTDGYYRETRRKVEHRVKEGCVTVEMEAAALFAVAQFRGVTLGQILYGGDDLSGETWDARKWNSRKEIRESLVDLAMDICLDL